MYETSTRGDTYSGQNNVDYGRHPLNENKNNHMNYYYQPNEPYYYHPDSMYMYGMDNSYHPSQYYYSQSVRNINPTQSHYNQCQKSKSPSPKRNYCWNNYEYDQGYLPYNPAYPQNNYPTTITNPYYTHFYEEQDYREYEKD